MKKIKFIDDKLPFEVIVESKRFAVCTRPIDKKVDRSIIKGLTEEEIEDVKIYTLIDRKEGYRGPNNRVFNSYDYSKHEDCLQCLRDLESGDVEISQRNKVALNIQFIIND